MTRYKLSGDVQGLQQNPAGGGSSGETTDISFLLGNYTCEPPRDGLPKLVIVRMIIGRPAPDFNGMTAAVEGTFGDNDGSLAASSIYVKQINYRVSDIWQNPVLLIAIIVFGLIFVGVGIETIVSWPGPDGPWPIGAIFIAAGAIVVCFGIWKFFISRARSPA